ncbi:terminase large subunit domain-containing protein [Brevundimonas sp.]|uniref:terminase large subunit domain-containing protein n=1 Tax=Brevundimonas sp. TaxID=1871086 RepID=UPI002FCB7CAB
MTWNRWHALLVRWLAGEPIAALALEHGVSRSAIHWNAKKMGMRKKDHRDAVRLPKGPAPVRIEMVDGVPVEVVCAELSFRFDETDPDATVASICGRLRVASVAGADGHYSKLLRMVDQTVRVMGRVRARLAGGAAPADDEPGARLVLRKSQCPPGLFPDGRDWSTWLFLGGRGAGKTLAGASWLADQAEALGEGGRLALVGPTLHDVREVMIEGPSGLRALPRWTRATRPSFEPSRRRLVFAGGCIAHAFSAEDPDSLRGPQFSAAWADEFCAWPAVGARGAGETLALLRMGLRLPLPGSPAPRLVVTTTPRPTRALISLRDEPSCVLTHAGTADNADHLSAGFVESLRALYGGTRREAQEIEGRVVDLDGALFTAEMMARARLAPSNPSFRGRAAEPGTQEGCAVVDAAVDSESGPLGSGFALRAPRKDAERLERIIVALDPTTTATGDACGIVVAGARRRPDGVREAVILADRSANGLSPGQWARRAVRAAQEFGAAAMVAEVNQGGDMVSAVLKTAGCTLKVREVRATKGKRVRAEPVAALYEQGRVRHAPADGVPLSALEEELMAFGGEMEGAGSLDRADALVWAVTDLLIDAREGKGPRVGWL